MARTKRKINPLLADTEDKSVCPRIYRTGGYARLSVEDGGRAGADTMEVQEELIAGYINARPDMRLVEMYCDNGHTGTNFERPQFERLLQDVKAGKLDCIVVKDLSRFGRNYWETGNYLERIFPFLGVRFVAIADGFDTLTAARTDEGYTVPLKNIINEFYSKDISRKIGAALAVKQRQGDFIGTWAPYGYKKRADNPHRLEPDPETASVVKEIFQECLSGTNYVQIAESLNRREIPSPSRYRYLKGEAKAERWAKAVWRPPIIKKILSDEVYLGHTVQGRRRESFYEGKRRRAMPREEWVIVRNTHEPLIDEQVFWAVQKLMKSKS
ncbi:MAG: recombinase family protein [Clostridium sp.]|nr:recombinase family protein [Clostridium sp.]